MAESETNQTVKNQAKSNGIKPNQVETVSDVTIPLALVYTALAQFLDGDAQSASVKGGENLVVNVKKVVIV